MDILYFLVQQTMFFFIPLLIVALGGMFSERSGVINIALEGIMIIGAFSGLLFVSMYQDRMSGQSLLIIGMLIAMAAGIIFSLFHAFASIHLKADQTISSTALNMFAPAFCIFLAREVQNVQQISFRNTFRIEKVKGLGDIPVLGQLFFQNTYITTYIGLAILIISSIILYRTKFGLRLRSCGEHPQAAESVGISVYRIRYAGVIISGALAGLGGIVYIVPTSTNFNATVSGYGFLALAVLIFGQWKPWRIFLAALFFGVMKTLAAAYSGIPFLLQINIPDTFYKILPYVATLIVLSFTSKQAHGPVAAGIPYDKGAR
jgi:ABC-type uncharacterized transport system permease subunit